MTDPRVTEDLRRLAMARAERGTLEAQWQEIADLMSTMRSDFTIQRTMGEKRQQLVFDASPGVAGANLASGLYGLISSPANDWFEMRHEDDALNDRGEVRKWLSDVAQRMRQALAANGGRFYSKIFPLYKDLVFFGTSVFYCEKIQGLPEIYFDCRHLAECYVIEDAYGRINGLIRVWKWKPHQAAQYFGKDALPDPIAKALTTEADRRFEFVHVVLPNEDYMPGHLSPRGKKFGSRWISVEGQKLLRDKGYKRFPYQVPRWSQASVGPYGDSQAMLALPDVKMLNALAKVNLVGAQNVVAPATLATDEGIMYGFENNPNKTIYGGLDEMGRPRFVPFNSGARPDMGIEFEEKRRDSVREAFHASLMLMIAKPGATATEVLAMQDEKLRLMGPHLGRIQSEFLDPLLDWLFATMLEEGAFPEPPEVLLDYPAINVEYVSPLARAQKAGEGAALVRALDALSPLAAYDPNVLDNVDGDEFARRIWDAFGAHPKVLRDLQQVAAMRQQRSQAEDIQNMTASALPVTGSIKNMAQAQAAMVAARGSAEGAAA